MSLTAKQHILKLRETEYKLQKLQNNLVSCGLLDSGSTSMSDFLAHHKELMALPGSNRDSVPFCFNFQAANRYAEMKQTQKLTLPPKIPAKSMGRLNPYDDSFETDETERFGQKIGYQSKALHSLLNELEKQASKISVAFPNLDKLSLLNKTPFLRGLKNSKGYLSPSSKQPRKPKSKTTSSKSSMNSPTGGSSLPSKLASKQSIFKSKANKVKTMWNNQVSETASTSPSELILHESDSKSIGSSNNRSYLSPPTPSQHSPVSVLSKQNYSESLKENLAYALGSSNLMGVILPPNSSQTKSRGPNTWTEKKPINTSINTVVHNASEVDENDNISAKEAVNILRRRKFPVRKSPIPKHLRPHERGLIGVEISNFEPQCAFFYRDRDGNYNPHLYHSRNVTEGMRKGKPRRNSYIRHPV